MRIRAVKNLEKQMIEIEKKREEGEKHWLIDFQLSASIHLWDFFLENRYMFYKILELCVDNFRVSQDCVTEFVTTVTVTVYS